MFASGSTTAHQTVKLNSAEFFWRKLRHPLHNITTSRVGFCGIRIEEFEDERAWWGNEKDGFESRVENERAWCVSIEQIKAGSYNLDLKNPHNPDTGPGDVDHLLAEYEKLLAEIAASRAALKQELCNALTTTNA